MDVCLPSGLLVFLALLSPGQAQGLAWHSWGTVKHASELAPSLSPFLQGEGKVPLPLLGACLPRSSAPYSCVCPCCHHPL